MQSNIMNFRSNSRMDAETAARLWPSSKTEEEGRPAIVPGSVTRNRRCQCCGVATVPPRIDATRLSPDVELIASSVVHPLAGRLDAEVSMTVEIEAEIPRARRTTWSGQ
jgi:hypothetical protein